MQLFKNRTQLTFARSLTSKAPHRFVVDAHTHILPKESTNWTEKYGYDGFVSIQPPGDSSSRRYQMMQSGKLFRQVDANCFDTEARRQDMAMSHVQVQVVCTVPVMFSYWARPEHTAEIARELNDDLAASVHANPTRYVGLGTLPMNDPDLAIQELQRCMNTLGFAGIQIGSHINDKPLSDPTLFPIFEAAAALNAAILIHPWDMAGKELMNKYWLPWLVGMPAECSFAACSLIFGGVMRKLPNLRICLSHGGGSFPWTIGRIEHGFNVRPDLVALDNPESPRNYLKRFYYDGHVCDAHTLSQLIDLVGADRIMLGSDYPFPLGECPPGSLINELPNLEDATRDRLFFGTAQEWLGRTLHPLS